MQRVGVGLSTQEDPKGAAMQAAARALETAGLDAAEAALVFSTPAYGVGATQLIRAAVDVLGTRATAGATAHGVLGGGLEAAGVRAAVVVAFSGFEVQAFLVPELRSFEECVGAEIVSRMGSQPCERDLVVLLPDPSCFIPARLLAPLRHALAPACLVGGGAAAARGNRSMQWSGTESTSGGLSGLVLRSARPPRIEVTQSCHPITDLLTVTRARGHWSLELDGRPALDVYREVARGPLSADLRRAASVLLVALPTEGRESLGRGDYLVRNVSGFAEGPRAIAVAQALKRGEQLALALRDAAGAREDLKRMVGGLEAANAQGGLYFSCCARGGDFFGVPGLEAAYLQQGLGATPVGGMFGSCEIAPLGKATQLLTYTGVLALLSR